MGWMAIAVEDNTPVSFVQKQIKDILKSKYDIHPDDDRAIGSFDMSEIFNNISAFTTVLKGFSLIVGGLTLLAGVIAISNILLITVKERTKEIGVRRALGATPKIVMRQILIESVVITVFAGLVGFAISVGILSIMNSMWGSGDDFPFVNPMINIPQFTISFFLMVFFSMIIGLIPAIKAVNIKPIDALREE
jgi:putative ABC transport system permease protein